MVVLDVDKLAVAGDLDRQFLAVGHDSVRLIQNGDLLFGFHFDLSDLAIPRCSSSVCWTASGASPSVSIFSLSCAVAVLNTRGHSHQPGEDVSQYHGVERHFSP
jgi:hypothetical protein